MMDIFNLRQMLITLPGIIMAISFHEYAHAQMAVWLGDDTPERTGRLSLNPLAHLDPIGFIMLLIVRIGWAKPVMIDARNFKNPKRDDMLVSIAGPATNIILAIIFMALIKVSQLVAFDFLSPGFYQTMIQVFVNAAIINIVLCVFNLIPVPPLDGHHIFFGLFNLKGTKLYYQLYSKGTFILLLLIITNATDYLVGIPVDVVFGGLLRLFNL